MSKLQQEEMFPATAVVRSWSAQAVEAWEERFGKGTAPAARIGAALKPLVRAHGAEHVIVVWRRYVQTKDPRFCNPQDFKMRFGFYAAFGAGPLANQGRHMHANVSAAKDFIAEGGNDASAEA